MNPNVLASYALLSRLKRLGVTHAVVSPGSRSTPLAYCSDILLDTTVVIDERDAGFVALGISESTNRPCIVITTSGSAPTHLYPSVVEAFSSNVPLIILTADRPHEIRGRKAPQTIDQIDLYHSSVRLFIDSECPDSEIDLEQWCRYGSEIFSYAIGAKGVPGPVQFNMGMREPLVPDGDEVDAYKSWSIASDVVNQSAQNVSLNYDFHSREFELDPKVVDAITQAQSILVTIGRDSGLSVSDVLRLREKGYVVLADVTSELRVAKQSISYYDFVMRRDDRSHFVPELVLQFGDALTSRVFNESIIGCECIAFRPFDDKYDPYGYIDINVVFPDVTEVVDSILRLEIDNQNAEFQDRWLHVEQQVGECVKQFVDKNPNEEPTLYFALFEELTTIADDFNVLIASSMPIRYSESFAPVLSPSCVVYSHRGTNGIDGMLASAYGIARGSSAPTLCIVGDVAFSHNLGFLPHCVNLAKTTSTTCVYLVVDNMGGAIFSHLDQARCDVMKDSYMKLIQTSPNLEIEKLANASGAYYFAGEAKEIIEYVARAIKTSEPSVHVVHIQFQHDSGVRTMEKIRKLTNQVTV